jgi:hypothetical protein
MQSERPETKPIILGEDVVTMNPRAQAALSQPQRVEEAFPASDAFVVPWDPRALDCHPKE